MARKGEVLPYVAYKARLKYCRPSPATNCNGHVSLQGLSTQMPSQPEAVAPMFISGLPEAVAPMFISGLKLDILLWLHIPAYVEDKI